MENALVFLSPPRINGYIISPELRYSTQSTPKKEDISTPKDAFVWNQGRTPLSSTGESPLSPLPPTPISESGKLLKRGRPRAEVLPMLALEGQQNLEPNDIKCHICKRVFPREKSLHAHMRTHTGERPYRCDFPGCCKSFCQSGQLKTHQRLHTGEKPFACSAKNCPSRFTHANRHCVNHPYAPLKRIEDYKVAIPSFTDAASPEVIDWFKKQDKLKSQCTPTRIAPSLKKPHTKRSLYKDIENQWTSENNEPSNWQTLNVVNGENVPVHYSYDKYSPSNKRMCLKSPEKKRHFASNSPLVGGIKNSPVFAELQNSPTKRMEQHDRLMGALALVQLAHSDKF